MRYFIMILGGVLFVGIIDFTLKIDDLLYSFLVTWLSGSVFCATCLYLFYRYDLKKQK